jgi:hypothetical protein
MLQQRFGFRREHMTYLRNEEATRAGIVQAVEGLIQQARPNDIVVIHYSGHGSQVRDIHNDEPSGWDNTIVPADSGRPPYPNLDIPDDDIHLWLARLAQITPYITLIFDCCHSGSITRDAFGDRARWVEPDSRSVQEIMAFSAAPISTAAQWDLQAASREIGPSGWLPLGKSYVLIAGCRDEESSYEYTAPGADQRSYGALTYFLCRALRSASTGTTYRDVFEGLNGQVLAYQSAQHPQIEGQQDRALFDIHEISPPRFISVLATNQTLVTLDAGSAHGLNLGSRWAIYPQATKHQQLATAARLGLVEVSAVAGVTAEATILEGSATIEAGARAVEVAHAIASMQLSIELVTPARGAEELRDLARRIEQSNLLRLAGLNQDQTQADVRIYLIPPRTSAGIADPLPQIPFVEHLSWGAVNRQGHMVLPLQIAAQAGLDTLIRDLEKIARYRNALSIKNPNENPALREKITFKLKRKRTDHTWSEAIPDEEAGYIVFHDGELIGFTIKNDYHLPVYVSILDFGLSGGISLIYPPNRRSDKVEGGISLDICIRKEDEIELYFPPNFPAREGVETMKLFVTLSETDFSWLSQDHTRSLPQHSSNETPLEFLLRTAIAGDARDARPKQLPISNDWLTIDRSFLLRRDRD